MWFIGGTWKVSTLGGVDTTDGCTIEVGSILVGITVGYTLFCCTLFSSTLIVVLVPHCVVQWWNMGGQYIGRC